MTYKPVMTFHESYGDIPRALLALVKRKNVSPADYYFMEDLYGENNYEAFYNHIMGNVRLYV